MTKICLPLAALTALTLVACAGRIPPGGGQPVTGVKVGGNATTFSAAEQAFARLLEATANATVAAAELDGPGGAAGAERRNTSARTRPLTLDPGDRLDAGKAVRVAVDGATEDDEPTWRASAGLLTEEHGIATVWTPPEDRPGLLAVAGLNTVLVSFGDGAEIRLVRVDRERTRTPGWLAAATPAGMAKAAPAPTAASATPSIQPSGLPATTASASPGFSISPVKRSPSPGAPATTAPAFAPPDCPDAKTGDTLCVVTEDGAGGLRTLYATPLVACDITARLDITGENITVQDAPDVVIVRQGARTAVGSFRITNTKLAWRYSYKYKSRFGAADAEPDGTVYDLPFAPGTSQRVLQGYYGTFSHQTSAALDWDLGEGDAIHAAREGVVVATYALATKHGTDLALRDNPTATNYIEVAHADGTMAFYGHLMPGGVDVKVGQAVARGQKIGRSGWTGYATSPHLHFEVRSPTSPSETHTHEVRYHTATAPAGEVPQDGESYTAP